MTRYIVELEPGCWLAPWSSDPGRTMVISAARTFSSAIAAKGFLTRAKRANSHRSFANARVVKVRVLISEEP